MPNRAMRTLHALFGPAPVVPVEPLPPKVTLVLDDGRVITPVLIHVPGQARTTWLALGPESIGEFGACHIQKEATYSGDEVLMLALFQVYESKRFRFAPVPLDIVERTAHVNGHVTPPPGLAIPVQPTPIGS